jgi:hypothetical protein
VAKLLGPQCVHEKASGGDRVENVVLHSVHSLQVTGHFIHAVTIGLQCSQQGSGWVTPKGQQLQITLNFLKVLSYLYEVRAVLFSFAALLIAARS